MGDGQRPTEGDSRLRGTREPVRQATDARAPRSWTKYTAWYSTPLRLRPPYGAVSVWWRWLWQRNCCAYSCDIEVMFCHISDPHWRAPLFIIYFATVDVDSSHMTVPSSASWSRFIPPSNFVNGHVSTMWFMVCSWPQSQESDWARPHLCNLARHEPWSNGSSEIMYDKGDWNTATAVLSFASVCLSVSPCSKMKAAEPSDRQRKKSSKP